MAVQNTTSDSELFSCKVSCRNGLPSRWGGKLNQDIKIQLTFAHVSWNRNSEDSKKCYWQYFSGYSNITFRATFWLDFFYRGFCTQVSDEGKTWKIKSRPYSCSHWLLAEGLNMGQKTFTINYLDMRKNFAQNYCLKFFHPNANPYRVISISA